MSDLNCSHFSDIKTRNIDLFHWSSWTRGECSWWRRTVRSWGWTKRPLGRPDIYPRPPNRQQFLETSLRALGAACQRMKTPTAPGARIWNPLDECVGVRQISYVGIGRGLEELTSSKNSNNSAAVLEDTKRRGRPPGSGKRRTLSAVARRRISAAMKARWAKVKKAQG